MRLFTCLFVVSLMFIGIAIPIGCTVQVAPAPEAVVVEPGYYVDGDYVDAYGVYHPREYYYYDGYAWDRRDNIPPGFAPHDRGRGFVQAQIRRGPGPGGHFDSRGGPHVDDHHEGGPDQRR